MVYLNRVIDNLRYWGLHNQPVSAVSKENKRNRAFYVGTNYVLKVSSNRQEVETAIAFYDAAAERNLCAPACIRTTSGKEYVQDGDLFFYVTQRVYGATMCARDFCEGDYAAKARLVGEIIGQLHLVLRQVKTRVKSANLYVTLRDWAVPQLEGLPLLPESFCGEFLDIFKALHDKLPRQIIHRDPNPSNIIVSQNEWSFVDFELSEENLRIYDPCYAALAILSESFDKYDQARLSRWFEILGGIISGYASVIELTDEECTALPYVIIAIQLVSTAWFSEQDQHEELFETNKNITLWIIDHCKELSKATVCSFSRLSPQ